MIGNRLKELRKEKKFTIVQLCKFLQMNPNTYAKYERNERDVSTETLCKLADFYSVTTDYLLQRKEPSPKIEETSDTELEHKFLRAYFQLISPQLRTKVWELMEEILKSQISAENDDRSIVEQITTGAEIDSRESAEKVLLNSTTENTENN